MFRVTYNDFEKAVKLFKLIGLENRADLKKKYLELSKKYHPDMPDGDIEKFQQINKAYKILDKYVEKYKFSFSKEEFARQHPFSVGDAADSLFVAKSKKEE